jgi:protein-L-isoaspartate(D-aspartate) O-methyltransferase
MPRAFGSDYARCVRTDPDSTGANADNVADGPVNAEAEAEDEATTRRAALVRLLRENGSIRSAAVEDAMTAVPRHSFVPRASLADAYRDDTVATKHDRHGIAISAASQPSVVALMLEQLGALPGHRILEIGAGTGYNAALLAHLVGPSGQVTTVDIDADLVDRARQHLRAAGADNAVAVMADGALGHPDGAPYDRIIATVGAADIPPAWLAQLAPGGRLLVPLRLRGSVSRAIAFEREDATTWRDTSVTMCTFMPLRGIADDPRGDLALTVDGGVLLNVHRDQDADRAALMRVLDHPPTPVFTGVRIATRRSFEWLDLWLACTLPGGLSRLQASGSAVRSGLVRPSFYWGAMAAVDRDSIAYLTLRTEDGASGTDTDPELSMDPKDVERELGVVGHGPHGRELAERAAEQIRIWARGYQTRPVTIRLAQGAARQALSGQFVIDKAFSRIAVTWD